MTRTTPTVRDFTLLLPPGWARIPLDDRVPLRIKQVVDERMSGLAVEQQQRVRTALTHELREALASARAHGGTDVFLSLDPVAGMPVPASAVVSHMQGDGESNGLAGLVETVALGGDGVVVEELDLVEVAGEAAIRRLGSRVEPVAAAGGLPGGALHVTQLEYYVPIPGSDGILLLAFSTPIEQLGPPLVQLFDVMATSLRWVTA